MVGMGAKGSGSFVSAYVATGLVGTGGCGVAIKVTSGTWYMSVSYTHLDVYKRQA